MKRRGFLQAILGAAAVPAAVKAAEAFDSVPELPVVKPAAEPEPLPAARYAVDYGWSAFTVGADVSDFIFDMRPLNHSFLPGK